MSKTSYIVFPQDSAENNFLAKPKTAVSTEENKDELKKAVKKKANPFIGDIEKEKERLENKKKEDSKEKNKKKKDSSKKSDKKDTNKTVDKKKEKKEVAKPKEKIKKTIDSKASSLNERKETKEIPSEKKNATPKITEPSKLTKQTTVPVPAAIDTIVKTQKPVDKSVLFTTHSLKVNGLSPQYRQQANQDGIFIGLIAAVGVLAWLGYYQRKRFIQLLNSFFTIRYFNQLVREDNATLQRVFILMSVVFAVVAPLFLYQSLTFYKFNLIDTQGITLFLLCVLIIVSAYFIKVMIIAFLGFVTQNESRSKEYTYNVFLTNNMLAIGLIPLVMLFEYGTPFMQTIAIKAGITCFFIAFLYRAFRSALMATNKRGLSIYHLFLYFCVLELLPLVVLSKIVGIKI